MKTRTTLMRILLFFEVGVFLTVSTQAQNAHITVIGGGTFSIQAIQWEDALELDAIQDSLFDTLEIYERAFGYGWKSVDTYRFRVTNGNRDEVLVFKVEYNNPKQTIIGCFGGVNDVEFKIFPFENRTGVINSMEMFRKAYIMEKNGKRRQANKLYKQAAECGNSLAAGKLAFNYYHSIGCAKNKKNSQHWATIGEGAFGGTPWTISKK